MAETTSTVNKGAAPAGPHPTNGLAIASLVTGIVAFIFGWVFVFGFLVGATAIVLGIIALKKPHRGSAMGMSIAGIVTGAVGALWSVVVSIFFIISLVTLGIGGATAGVALDQANQALANYNAENKALIEAKKDFKKGETATFGQFEVKVNSVERNYVPEDSYVTVDEGKEFIVVNVTVKNVGDESKYISSYDLKLSDAGVADSASYYDVDPSFDGGDVSAGASTSGNIMYEVDKDATDLKLQYELFAYDLNGGGAKTLTYTLAL
jgi:hypothetical protein